jgi:cell division protein FtsB
VKKTLLKGIKNKYITTTLGFLVWMLFFNDIDLVYVIQQKRALNDMEQRSQDLKQACERAEENLFNLTTNTENLERFAREEYLMKKPDEDLFLIRRKKAES